MSGETFGSGISRNESIKRAGEHRDYFSKLTEPSPIEDHGHILIKRDDLFRPFENKTLNGGKLRQIITVLRDCRSLGVITAASIRSPQVPLVAGAAHYLGLSCVAVVGGSAMTKELRIANELGADIRRATSGRHRALYAEVSRVNADLGYHVISYGIAPAAYGREFFMTQSQQAENLPDALDALVVTCGSGVSAAAILVGLWRFSKSVSKLILVGTAPSRLNRVSQFVQSFSPEAKTFLDSIELTYIDLFSDPHFRYEQELPFTLCGVRLHPRYEAKAFRHVLEKTNFACGRVMFWIVGADLIENQEGTAHDDFW
jgi:1-aminocyclopropane-1-carboxylate deaminase/D-cysteine desulfhydrase-like pyridoxal-dependent ACC family enzyme